MEDLVCATIAWGRDVQSIVLRGSEWAIKRESGEERTYSTFAALFDGLPTVHKNLLGCDETNAAFVDALVDAILNRGYPNLKTTLVSLIRTGATNTEQLRARLAALDDRTEDPFWPFFSTDSPDMCREIIESAERLPQLMSIDIFDEDGEVIEGGLACPSSYHQGWARVDLPVAVEHPSGLSINRIPVPGPSAIDPSWIRRLINRSSRYEKLLELDAPEVALTNEEKEIQDSFARFAAAAFFPEAEPVGFEFFDVQLPDSHPRPTDAGASSFLCCDSGYLIQTPDETVYVTGETRTTFAPYPWPAAFVHGPYIVFTEDPHTAGAAAHGVAILNMDTGVFCDTCPVEKPILLLRFPEQSDHGTTSIIGANERASTVVGRGLELVAQSYNAFWFQKNGEHIVSVGGRAGTLPKERACWASDLSGSRVDPVAQRPNARPAIGSSVYGLIVAHPDGVIHHGHNAFQIVGDVEAFAIDYHGNVACLCDDKIIKLYVPEDDDPQIHVIQW